MWNRIAKADNNGAGVGNREEKILRKLEKKGVDV